MSDRRVLGVTFAGDDRTDYNFASIQSYATLDRDTAFGD
jgi:hypothetical protein